LEKDGGGEFSWAKTEKGKRRKIKTKRTSLRIKI